ncbi:MAG: hypothetical protein QG582_1220 [Candidatus Thermoplasmatota archaeon]|nr:hypothetical protein [Candidatus Thermoplasmatota archaeon]
MVSLTRVVTASAVIVAMMLAGLAGLFPQPAVVGAADEDGAWQASTEAPLRQWTIAMYWAGDNDLDGLTDTFIQMWREHTTNTDDIALSVFIDRLDAPANISTFTEEGWVERAALGEVNSSSPDTLQSFIEYSMAEPTLEAENYMLILQDHGLGYLGICSDVGLPDSDIEKAWMSIDGLGKAVRGAIDSTGEELDILTLDACTMSVVEVAYELRDTASYLVASELAVPFDGMNYRALLDGLSEDPYIEPVDLARKMVADYAEWYSAPLGTYPTLYPYLQDFATLSVIDLALIGEVGDAFAALSAELLPKDPTLGKTMKDASMDAFVTIWCNNMGCGFYSDIVTMFGAVAEEVRQSHPAVAAACDDLVLATQAAIVDTWASWRFREVPNGLSVFVCPSIGMFDVNWDTLGRTYDAIGLDFVDDSSWDEVLGSYFCTLKQYGL